MVCGASISARTCDATRASHGTSGPSAGYRAVSPTRTSGDACDSSSGANCACIAGDAYGGAGHPSSTRVSDGAGGSPCGAGHTYGCTCGGAGRTTGGSDPNASSTATPACTHGDDQHGRHDQLQEKLERLRDRQKNIAVKTQGPQALADKTEALKQKLEDSQEKAKALRERAMEQQQRLEEKNVPLANN